MPTPNKKNRFDLLDKLEVYLQRSRNYHRSWWLIMAVLLVLLGLTAIPLGYLFGDKQDLVAQNIVTNQEAFATPAEVLTYVSYGILVVPFVFLAGSWISGVNNTSRSKYFHLFVWVCDAVAALLIFVAIILAFRAGMH